MPASEQTSLQFDGLDAAGTFNLKNLTSLLQAFKALPQDTKLAGQAKIEVHGSLKKNQLQLDHAQLDATEFLVSQGSKTARDQHLKLTTAGTIHLGERKIALEPVNLKSSSGAIAVSGLTVADWSDLTKPIGATIGADLDLSALSGLLKTVGVLPEDIGLAGKADIDTQLSFEADKLELGQTTVNATDFLFQKGEQTLSEKKIQLTTRGSVNLEKKAAVLKPFELQTTTGNITLPELELNDWSNLQNGVKTKGSIDLELGRLAVFLDDILKLPDGTSIAGQTTLTIDTDLSNAKQQFVKIDGTIAPFELSLPDKKPLSEKTIKLMIDLNGDVSEQNFAINKLALSSSPVSLNANGTIKPDNKEHVLKAQGAMKLDLEALSSYIRSLSELKLEMTGASEKPFSIKATSLDGKWVEIPKRSEIVTSFHADKIHGFGLLVESLEVPIKLANGIAEIDIQGTVNKGKMSLQPAIDFSAEPPVISIPENNLVLTGVGFSEDMPRDLLAQLHPIFIGAAVSQGTLDLGIRHFKWPMGAAERKKAAFSGTITFNEVKLRAGGLLTPLLEVMKVEEREITIGDQPMDCIGENDRIRCSPLEILVKDHSLMLSGSIGFDKSLDYIAQIPVTQRMVGGDAYKYLEGTSISVPIGGTVSKPSIRKDVVQTALKDLVIQAGKKQITDQAGKLLQNLFK